MSGRIYSFPPLIDAASEILILGSVPGVKSLEMQQYYAHPQNTFWKILFSLFGEPETTDYERRKIFLKKQHIALWDVIDSCVRTGSLDSAIREEEANRVAELLHDYPHVKAIFCNGQKSYKSLRKMMDPTWVLPVEVLPSTSPLHTISFEKKREEWSAILKYLL